MCTANNSIPYAAYLAQAQIFRLILIKFLLRRWIPFLLRLLEKAYAKLQEQPHLNPPDDPDLAALSCGLVVMRSDAIDLETALYKYLCGELDAAGWLDAYTSACRSLRFGAFETAKQCLVADARIREKVFAELKIEL